MITNTNKYVAIKREIQKHPHQGSLGSRERTKREGETRHQDEKEVEKEYVAVEKDIQTPRAHQVPDSLRCLSVYSTCPSELVSTNACMSQQA